MHFNTFTRPLLLCYKALCDTYKKKCSKHANRKINCYFKNKIVKPSSSLFMSRRKNETATDTETNKNNIAFTRAG